MFVAGKTVIFGREARQGLLEGTEVILRAAVTSLGPKVGLCETGS